VRCGEATLPEVSETSRLDPGDLLELGVPPVPTPKPTRSGLRLCGYSTLEASTVLAPDDRAETCEYLAYIHTYRR
jgi:hypothetical protein